MAENLWIVEETVKPKDNGTGQERRIINAL